MVLNLLLYQLFAYLFFFGIQYYRLNNFAYCKIIMSGAVFFLTIVHVGM